MGFTSDNTYLPDDTYTLSSDVLIPKGAYISTYTTIEKLLLNYNRRKMTGKVSGNTHMLIYLGAGTYNFTVQVSLVSGSTAPTTYTPYIGQTNTLTLPETVYGGEVDAVTGEGQETWQILNNPSSYDYYEGAPEGGWSQSEDAVAWYLDNPTLFPYKTKVLSNIFHFTLDVVHTAEPYLIGSDNHFIAFRLPRSVAATGNDVKNWLASNDVEIAFETITQTPFTATGAQSIPALAGVNTVLTDADSVTVTGRADPIKRITDLEDAVASQT